MAEQDEELKQLPTTVTTISPFVADGSPKSNNGEQQDSKDSESTPSKPKLSITTTDSVKTQPIAVESNISVENFLTNAVESLEIKSKTMGSAIHSQLHGLIQRRFDEQNAQMDQRLIRKIDTHY